VTLDALGGESRDVFRPYTDQIVELLIVNCDIAVNTV